MEPIPWARKKSCSLGENFKIFCCYSRKTFCCFEENFKKICSYSCHKLCCFNQSCLSLVSLLFHFFVRHVSPFYIQLFYFLAVSAAGYLALESTKLRTTSSRPKKLDVFFMSVSATTVSSMSTVEMEVFSNTQHIIMIILMFLGGEVFVSMLGLQLGRSKFPQNNQSIENRVSPDASLNSNSPVRSNVQNRIELGFIYRPQLENQDPQIDVEHGVRPPDNDSLKYKSIKFLVYIVLGYLVVVHVVGSFLVWLYITRVESANQVLKNKGLDRQTFSVFTTVSTFANCGFIPTNENMIVFNKNSGLLLLLIPLILMGNTFYPHCLLFVIWFLKKATKRPEFGFMLKNHREIGYSHLFPGRRAAFLAFTLVGFIVIQFVLFAAMEWSSQSMDGLNSYQKFADVLFQVVNTRHAGENSYDLSAIAAAVLVLFIVMMYLPSYTTFFPTKEHVEAPQDQKTSQSAVRTFMESLMLSELSYLALFIILICITERDKMREDPLNFNLLFITFEVISAYNNVGLTTGYSCERLLKPDSSCVSKWYGFVGKWSNEGKVILIIVMFFGKLKKFRSNGGKAWDLSKGSLQE